MAMRDQRVPGLSEEENRDFFRRRRARNWAILLALIALVVVFYLISIARLSRV
jgi:hypothetical protein